MTYKKSVILQIITILVVSSVITFTFAEKIISTYGIFETDGVDVSIKTEQSDKTVAPDMTVRYSPVITYKGVDAYIRFKLNISTDAIKLSQFKGLNSDWVKQGEYFYYSKPVKNNTKLKTFTSFHIPPEYDETEPQDFMESVFNITATCDAVQAENFTPDFKNKNPWGDLIIQDNSYDGNKYKEKRNKDHAEIRLNFKNPGQYSLSSDQMVKDRILPGDTYCNSIILENKGKENMDVYFSVNRENQKEEYNLLDALTLSIKVDGKDFYKGNLRAEELNKWGLLTELEKGKKHVISYKIHAPKEMDNDYEEQFNHFKWNFKVNTEEKNPLTGNIDTLFFWLSIILLSLTIIWRMKQEEEELT